jgi:hypothetical protein
MSDDFHRTPMGRRYYEVDFPKLVTNLGRIADALETKQNVIYRPLNKPGVILKAGELYGINPEGELKKAKVVKGHIFYQEVEP